MNKQTHTFEGRMDLIFVKESGQEYVDLPEFLEAGAGNKDDLEMIAGADTFCDELSDGGDRLKETISTDQFPSADWRKSSNSKRLFS